MRHLIAVIAFTLLTVGFFAGYSNYGIPQIEPAPPPKPEKLNLATMTLEQFIAFGERVFNGKGTCPLCHNPVGARAPLLENIAPVVANRLADDRYRGKATDVESYLLESMIDPSAFVVAGFGKKGTGDSVSPMPNVTGGSIGLSDTEIKGVIGYLQDASGIEVTVEIPADAPEETQPAEAETRQPFKTPKKALTELGCGACHKVAGEAGEIGPDLTGIGGKRDKAYLRRAILDPNADVTKGYEPDQMPADYGAQMYAAELEMLVDYLAGLK